MVNFTELAASLMSSNVGVVLKTLGELRERIDIVHTSEYGSFLLKVFPVLRDLILTRLNPQFIENSETKCRQIILEIFNRFPNSDALKPYVFDLLKLSLRVLIVDNEENSLTALRIIFDLHKSFRPNLENQVQPFLEIVQKILKNIPVSARTMFATPSKMPVQPPPIPKQPSMSGNSALSSSQSAPSLSSMGVPSNTSGDSNSSAGAKTIPKPGTHTTHFLKSMDSFKVLTECPLIIMLLFQVYPKFIQKNIPQMLPLMMNILGLQFSASNLSPQLRVRFREFVAAQVKTLSLITYFLRGFTELMRPYEDTIANNVLVLIRFCPQESVSTRKELLVDFRHILATDFRKGFYKHLDFFIDETFLMGPGQQAYETLRPLAFSTIADLVHHSREHLSFAQLSKVVFLFAKSIHDVQLPVVIQTTSVRILMNISENFASTSYQNSDLFQRDRKLLSRILRTLILKFDIINHQLVGNSDGIGNGNGYGSTESGVGGPLNEHALSMSVFETLEADLLSVRNKTGTDVPGTGSSSDDAIQSPSSSSTNSISGSVMNESVFSSSINLASDSMKDVKSLIKNLLQALKVVLVSISAMQKASNSTNQPPNTTSAPSTGNVNMSLYVLADDEVDHMKLFLKWALKSIDSVCKVPVPTTESSTASRKKVNKSSSAVQPSSSKKELTSTAASLAASNYETDQEVKDLLEPMISVFTVLQPLCLIRSVLGENLDYVVELSHTRPIFISLLHQLLMSTSTACSQLTMDTLLTFIVTKLPELANKSDIIYDKTDKPDDVQRINFSSTILKIFKVSLGIISVHPDNEKVLRPRLCSIIHICLRLASESKYTLNYILVIRTLFRSISGGKFEHAYKEMNVVLPTLLKGFGHLLHRSKHVETQNAILELSLTIPCRLDTMLLHFPFLLEMFCRAVTAKKSDSLPNLALRTLEFWTDNLKPDYLFSLMSSKPDLLHRIFTGICQHLKPPPYPYGSLAARVLGKFGGKNTRFLRNFFSPEYSGSGPHHLLYDPSNVSTSKNSQTFFSIEMPSIFENKKSFVAAIDDSVDSACSILGDLVSTYAVKEIEILSLITSCSDNASAAVTKESPLVENDKEELEAAIDNILLSRREDAETSFQPRDESTTSHSSFSTDLYNQISAETVAVVQSVIDSQVESSYNLIKSALVRVLPTLPFEALGIRQSNEKFEFRFLKCKEHEPMPAKSFSVFESSCDNDRDTDFFADGFECEGSFQNLMTKMLHSLLCSTIFPQLNSKFDVPIFIEGLCYHVAILDSLARQQRLPGTYVPIVFACALNEAIMRCLADTRTDVFQSGVTALRCWLAAIAASSSLMTVQNTSKQVILSTKSPTDYDDEKQLDLSSTPLEYFLFQAVDLCSSSSLWEERMAGVRAINELCKSLPPHVLKVYEFEVIESLLAAIHVAEFERYSSVLNDVIHTLNIFLYTCYSPLVKCTEGQLSPINNSVSQMEVVADGDEENKIDSDVPVDDARNCLKTQSDTDARDVKQDLTEYSSPSKDCLAMIFAALESSKILVRIAARTCFLKIIHFSKLSATQASPFELILPEVLLFFSRPVDTSTITSQTLGHVSKMSFLLGHLPSNIILEQDVIILSTDKLIVASSKLDEALSNSFPPFHQSLLNSSSTVVSDPAKASKISHNFKIADDDVMNSCHEENIDIVISTFPLVSNIGIELRSHMINLFGALFSSPNISKEVSLEVTYMPFRNRCIGILHQSLSLKWVQIIERARVQMISISNNCTIVFKDIYDNMKPILPLFEDIRNLTLPKLKTLEAMIRIVRNKSYLNLSWKLLDQLKHWTNPSRIMQLNLWPAGEEVMIAAAIVNIFSVLPWAWDESTPSSNIRHISKTAHDLQAEALNPPPVLEKSSNIPETNSSIPPLLLQSANMTSSSGGSQGIGTNNNSSNIHGTSTIGSNINNNSIAKSDGVYKSGTVDLPHPAKRASSTGSASSASGSRTSGSVQTQFPIFFNRLVDILMRIERVRCQYQCSQTVESPVLIALTRLLEAFPVKSLNYFMESVNLSRPDVIHLLLDLFPLSSRCPKFMERLFSDKGSLALKQCIDAYCESIRNHDDTKNSNVRAATNGIGNRNRPPVVRDGVLFSSAIQARLAEVKQTRSHSTSLDGTEKAGLTSSDGVAAPSVTVSRSLEVSESSDSHVSSKDPITVKVEGEISNENVHTDPPKPSQQPPPQQPQHAQLQNQIRSSTSTPSPIMNNDVLSSPLLLSAYQMQPPNMSMLLDKKPGNLIPITTTGPNNGTAGMHAGSGGSNISGTGIGFSSAPRGNDNGAETPFSVLTEDSIRRAAANTIRVVQKLCTLQPNFMADHPALLKSLRVMLILSINKNNFSVVHGCSDPGPLKSSPKTCTEEELKVTADKIDSKFQEHFEIKTICESLLDHYRRNLNDILVLFDLMPVLCTPSTLDFSFLLQFFKVELSTLLSFQLKRDILRAFLSLCDTKTVSWELKVKTLQVMIIPLLLQLFRDNNLADVKKYVLDVKTIKLIMKNAFFSGDVLPGTNVGNVGQSALPSSGATASSLDVKSAESLGEPMKIELLKVATLLIEHCAKELVDNRKDLIKFAWNHLKTEDVTTKHWAYVNVCRFISAYDTPPKIILQVYVALLRTYQVEHRDLITMALDTLVPALPKRLRYEDFVKAMKWTKKIVNEEGHSLPQLIHVWNLIIRHSSLFYPFRSHFIPQMVSSISRLGLPPNCPVEHRQVALGCAEVLVGWEVIRHKRIDKRISESFLDDFDEMDDYKNGDSSQVGDGMEVDEVDGSNVMDISVDDDDKDKGGTNRRSTTTSDKSADTPELKKDATAPPASSTASSSVIKINEKDDDFALHPSMVQMLVIFLIRLGLYAADSRDRAMNRLTDKCISLYGTLVTVVPMKGIKVSCFERLLQNFTETYSAAASGKGGGGGGDKAAAALAMANKSNNKAAAQAAMTMMKNKKGEKVAVPPKAVGNSSDGKTPANVSEKVFSSFLQFLTASLESLDPSESLFFDNISLVKQIISPFFVSEHMMKSGLGDLFRKLILKSIKVFSLHTTPDLIKKSGFFHELSTNIDMIIMKDYHEVESEAAAAALAANSVNRKSGQASSATIGKDNYAVCYWTLQFLHDICSVSPSWIENHGTSMVSMCVLFMTLHLNKVTKNCSKVDMSSANRTSLSNGKGSLLVNACTCYPTPQIAMTTEVHENSSYVQETFSRRVNPNIAAHQNTLTSSLILLVKLLGSALEMGYLRSQKDFTLSILHSILEYSDDYTLWGLAVMTCCRWIARPGSPVSPFEQGMLFNKISNIERWAMDVHAQCAILRVVSLVEVVMKKSDNGTLPGLKKLFSSKYSLPVGMDALNSNITDCVQLRSLGLLCSNSRLRESCASRLLESRGNAPAFGNESNALYKRFITVFDMNFKPFEKLYWPVTLTPLLLSCNNELLLSANDCTIGLKDLSSTTDLHVEIEASHPYYSFLQSLNASHSKSFADENAMVLQSLKTLPLVNPVAGDSIWKQCLEKVWGDTSTSEQKLLTNVITRNISCHNYVKCFTWPEKLSYVSASALPHNVPQSIVQFLMTLDPKPDFPISFLGAVGCGYRLWHTMGNAIEDIMDHASVSDDDMEHAVRVLIATYSDAGDEDAMVDVYRSYSKCPRTKVALDLESYGYYTEAQGKLFLNMKDCLGSTLDSSLANVPGSHEADDASTTVSEVEMEMWEERWMHDAKKLSQWDVLFDYSMKMNVEDVSLEASSMLSNWPKMNRLLIAMPSNNASVSIQIERGGIIPNPEIKMYEAMINIVDSKPHRSEKVVLSAIETALHKWHSLPPLVGGASSNASHKWLLHTFHRVVELRESMNMIAEVMKSTLVGKGGSPPDLKGNILTWRERLPEVWDDMHQWDSLLHWRVETFSMIKKSFQSRNLDESQLACAHDMPWTIIMHAQAARKNSLINVSSKILNKLKDISAMDVFDAYSKLREQILVYLPDADTHARCVPGANGNDLDKGLSIINSTNLEYFDAEQKAELFRLKALFQLHLENLSSTTTGHAASQQSFAQSVQVCPTYAKGWLSWGELCYDTFVTNMNSNQGASSAILRNANLEYALSTIICILKAVESNSELGRILISRVILLVTTADDSSSTLANALLTHGASLPLWIWIPVLPTMLKALYRCVSCRTQMSTLLCSIAKSYPAAMVQQLMALDVSSSNPAVDEILQRISRSIRLAKDDLLASNNWFIRHIENKFSAHRFAWSALIFLDTLLKNILDDFSCRFDDMVPVAYLESVDTFIQTEISTEYPSVPANKKRRGKMREKGHESVGSLTTRLPSEDDVKLKFASEFEGLLAGKESKRISISEFVDLIQRWIDVMSKCATISAGHDRLVKYRFSQSKRYRGTWCNDILMHDFSLCGGSSGAYDDSVLTPIEIPGQYALASDRFREPRPDLHIKVIRVSPRVRQVFLAGEVLKYQICILGSDGEYTPYNVSVKNVHSGSSSGNESLFGQCAGFFEWCLKQHSLTRANDISISHPTTVALRRLQVPKECPLSGGSTNGIPCGSTEGIPSFTPLDTLPPTISATLASNSSNSYCDDSESGDMVYSLTRAVMKELSLEGLCYAQSPSKSKNPITQSCDDAVLVRKDFETKYLNAVTESANEQEIAAKLLECQQAAYAAAISRNQTTDVLKAGLQNEWSSLLRNNNGEAFFSLRKTMASQLGVLGAISYILQAKAPTARERIFSSQGGRVFAYNVKPISSALAIPHGVGDDEVKMEAELIPTGGQKANLELNGAIYLRLTPSMVDALSMRLINSTLKSALGNTAVAISNQKSLIETVMTTYCLDGICRGSSVPSNVDNHQDSSQLIAKAYAASFVKRCCLLAPQPLKHSEDNAGETRCKLDHDVVTEECCDELAVTIIERALYPYHQSCKLDAKPFVTTGTSMTPSESSVSVPSQCRDISWKPWL